MFPQARKRLRSWDWKAINDGLIAVNRRMVRLLDLPRLRRLCAAMTGMQG